MRTYSKLLATAGALALTATLFLPQPTLAQSTIQAYVPPEFGDTTGVVARMEALGWTVTTTHTLDLEGEDPYTAFDVIWIVSDSSDEALAYLRSPFSRLAAFAAGGGVLIITATGSDGLDVAPGGLDVMNLPEGGAGAVAITATDHPLITGAGTGGVSLTESDLDPEATGGTGYLTYLPIEGTGATTVAENAAGAVFLKYAEEIEGDQGDGHILVGSLSNPSSAWTDNVLRYAESLLP